MVIDHTGIFLFPDNYWLRGIGRLSFPLFAWLISNGAKYTKNLNAYITRLFVFGLISQISFFLANRLIDPSFSVLNTLFTLCAGLICIKILGSGCIKSLKFLSILIVLIISYFSKVDYGPLGVLSILFFYLFSENPRKMLLSQSIIFMLLFPIQVSLISGFVGFSSFFQSLALFSLIFIGQYNFKQGPKTKYLFYIFYPLHFAIFYLLIKFF